MTKQSPKLEWQMCEGETEWQVAQTTLQQAEPKTSILRAAVSQRRWRWTFAVLLIILLPALIGAYWEVRRADQVMTHIENEVRAAVVAEAWTQPRKAQTTEKAIASWTGYARNEARLNLARYQPETGQESAQGPMLEARHVEVRGEYAMVEVWRNESVIPWRPAPYRETRFYHETEQGWQLTAPPEIFWQLRDTLRAGRFTFVYGARDWHAVLVASRQVEQVDADIRRELGLPVTDEALTIKVVTTTVGLRDPAILNYLSYGDKLFAPSPAMLALPAHISEGDALLQLVAGLLVERSLDEALTGSSGSCIWQGLTSGMRLWLLWEHSDLPSLDRYYTMRGVHDLKTLTAPLRLAWFGPDLYECTSFAGERIDSLHGIDGPAVAFVDFAVFTYGRDSLPALIDGMHRYDTWEMLIPEVYGVGVAEFEAGWQEYIRKNDGGKMKAEE